MFSIINFSYFPPILLIQHPKLFPSLEQTNYYNLLFPSHCSL